MVDMRVEHKSNEAMKIDPRERSCCRAILAGKTPIRDAERVLQPGLTTSFCERVGSFSEIFRVVCSQVQIVEEHARVRVVTICSGKKKKWNTSLFAVVLGNQPRKSS